MINEKHFSPRSGSPKRTLECTIIKSKCVLRGGALAHEEM